MGYINLKYSELGSVHITPEICQLKVRIVMIVAINVDLIPTLHYRLRAIRGGPLGLVNFTPHFIVIQIFQILFLSPVSFYTHPNISDIFVGDEINLFNLTFHDITYHKSEKGTR